MNFSNTKTIHSFFVFRVSKIRTKTHKFIMCFLKTHNQKHKHIINLTNYVFWGVLKTHRVLAFYNF